MQKGILVMKKKKQKYIIIDEIPDLKDTVLEGELDLYKSTICNIILELTSNQSDASLENSTKIELKTKGGSS